MLEYFTKTIDTHKGIVLVKGEIIRDKLFVILVLFEIKLNSKSEQDNLI